MKICLVGEGAFGNKHLEAIRSIDGVEVASIAGGEGEATKAVAEKYNIPHWTLNLDEAKALREIVSKNPEAIIKSKKMLNAAPYQSVAEGLLMESELQSGITKSINQIEAVMSTLEKRAPQFENYR